MMFLQYLSTHKCSSLLQNLNVENLFFDKGMKLLKIFFYTFSDSLKYIQWLKSVGVDHYNSTIFQEYDMGSHTLQMGHFKSYDKDNIFVDEGTYVSMMHPNQHVYI